MKPRHEKALEVVQRCQEYPETELSRLEIKNLLLCYQDAVENRYETWEIAEAFDLDGSLTLLLDKLKQNREQDTKT